MQALVETDTTIGRRLREFRVVSSEVYSPTPLVGRHGELADLRSAFTAASGTPVVRVVAGLGGIGKTSIARHYASTHQQRYGLVWWIHGQHPDTIADQFRALLAILAPGEATGVDDPVATVHAVLANRTGRWLLILDNLPDAAAAHGLIPASGAGDVLITSQARTWPGYRTVTLESLDTAAGAELLISLSGDDDRPHAQLLADELGGLPLALAQAGPYIARTPTLGIAEYLRLYRQRHAELHAQGRAPDYPDTIATTWQLAFDTLPIPARTLLNLLCWWAPESVPLHLLLTGLPVTQVPEQIRDLVRPLMTDELVRNQAISGLDVNSLVTPAKAPGAVTVHRLVQAVTRAQPGIAPDPWAVCAARMVNAAYPTGPATRATLGEATQLQEHANAALEHLGLDHPDTLITRHNLAYWRGEAGDPVGAVAAFGELLGDYLRVWGPDHPGTLAVRHNLARSRGEAGDPAGAVATLEEVLADHLRVLGPDHPATLITRHNLAYWRGEAGDPVGAVAAFGELLGDYLRAWGPDHRGILITRHNLARSRGEAGDPVGAVAAFGELLGDYLRAWGPDHPGALITRHSLAYWRGEAGDPAGAVATLEEVLADHLRVLGPDHRGTLATRDNLAHWQRRLSEQESAPRDQLGDDTAEQHWTRADNHGR